MVPGRGAGRGHRARRAGADRTDQPRRQADEPDRILRDCPPVGTPPEEHPGMKKIILVLNTGSSSVKFSVFAVGDGELLPLSRGELEGIGTAPHFVATGAIAPVPKILRDFWPFFCSNPAEFDSQKTL